MSNKLINLLKEQMENRSDSVAMLYKKNNSEITMTWGDIKKSTKLISYFMLDKENNLNVQDKIAIFSQNKPNWSLVDFSSINCRICSVPIYPTTVDNHLIHIINDAEIKMVFVGSEEQYEAILSLKSQCPLLQKIILLTDDKSEDYYSLHDIFNKYENITDLERLSFDAELNERLIDTSNEDLVTLLYTSGTTGLPKGVMLDNENFAAAILSHKERIKIDENDLSLSFLPLSHIFERAWTYFVLFSNAKNYYLENPQLITKHIKDVKPTVMCSVPRFFEKVYSTVNGELENAKRPKKNLFKWASRIGRKVFTRKMNKEFISPLLLIQHWIANKLVYSKFQSAFGGRIRFFNCGGAGLQDDVNMFFQSLSTPIIYGYGLTETLATVSCYTKTPAIGSVGKAMPGVQIKIGENNEILIKSKTVTKGYYKLPEENKKSFIDGWFRTGDAGRLDVEGNLYYIERIKELMKTSNGKYICPQAVEGTILKDKYIEQVAIIAEGKSFVSALIVPNYEEIEKYAKEKLISFENTAELLKHSHIVEMLEKRIKLVQNKLNSFEQVKKFKLLEKPFSIQANEITPTLKLKRKVIIEKYHNLIDEIYNKKKNIQNVKDEVKVKDEDVK